MAIGGTGTPPDPAGNQVPATGVPEKPLITGR
jgi:hypothetical protein